VGALLLSAGFISFGVRVHEDSRTLRVVLWSNALLQVALFPIEIHAYCAGIITLVSGVLPNSILHGVLALGFARFALSVKIP
jgi:hypothetical protein